MLDLTEDERISIVKACCTCERNLQDAEIAFVALHPNDEDAKACIPFSPDSFRGKLLDHVLVALQLHRDMVGLAYIWPQVPPGIPSGGSGKKTYFPQKQIEHPLNMIRLNTRLARAKLFVTLGTQATSAIEHLLQSTNRQGQVVQTINFDKYSTNKFIPFNREGKELCTLSHSDAFIERALSIARGIAMHTSLVKLADWAK